MSLVGLADGIWSQIVLSDEEKSWRKGGDVVNVCDFGGAVGVLWIIIRVLLWLTLIEMKMIGKVVQLKKGLTWVRKMEVEI